MHTMKIPLSALAIALSFGQSRPATAHQTKARPAEQTQFSAEHEAVKRPVPVPKEVWAILKQDQQTLDACDISAAQVDTPPAECFCASKIHLGGPNETDLIVEGEGNERGVNVNTFWVFLHTKSGWKLALTIPAHDLKIKQSRYHGYRIIEGWGAAVDWVSIASFRFEEDKYEKFRELDKKI
jgi:hypothetical protein